MLLDFIFHTHIIICHYGMWIICILFGSCVCVFFTWRKKVIVVELFYPVQLSFLVIVICFWILRCFWFLLRRSVAYKALITSHSEAKKDKLVSVFKLSCLCALLILCHANKWKRTTCESTVALRHRLCKHNLNFMLNCKMFHTDMRAVTLLEGLLGTLTSRSHCQTSKHLPE